MQRGNIGISQRKIWPKMLKNGVQTPALKPFKIPHHIPSLCQPRVLYPTQVPSRVVTYQKPALDIPEPIIKHILHIKSVRRGEH
jgi:hypothetical protein